MATLETFKKLANKEHELVLMVVTQAFTPYSVGDLAGFQPDAALDAYTKGFAVPCDKEGKEIAMKKAAPSAPPPKDQDDAPTEIPVDWEQLHHLQRVKLAKDISGRNDITKKDDADAVIRDEVERRAGGQPPADQSQT